MKKPSHFPTYNILGVNITAASINQAVDYIIDRATNHSRSAAYIVKPYVEFMDRAADDPDLRRVLNGAELALPDGVALIWAAHFLYGEGDGDKGGGGRRNFARLLKTLFAIVLNPKSLTKPLPERIAGTNFTWPLLEAAERAGATVFLIGEVPGGIQTVAAVIKERLPNIKIAGTLSGRDRTVPAGQVSDAWIKQTLDTLRRADPDITLVGMGFPLQEYVMTRLAPGLRHGLLIGEGGTFDYRSFGGHQPKAPIIMQRTGLEWLWRLIIQPRRIKRQFAIPRFIWRVWLSRKK